MATIAPEAQETTATEKCPARDMRKTGFDTSTSEQPVVQTEDGIWHIYGYDEVRQVLRNDLAYQGGFRIEDLVNSTGGVLKNLPILYIDGPEHNRLRRETNKFFTPSITDREYREFMDEFADELIGNLKKRGRVNLSDLSMDMAVKVASQIVGLTNSVLPGFKGRLNAMLETGNLPEDAPKWKSMFLGQWNVLQFLLMDVLPAIRARRKNPQNDVISYLIDRDYSAFEILTECTVYGVAGMVTTREFIAVALWHLLENPHLAQRMRVGSQEERYAILHEILRLEPVVGKLQRRATEDLVIETEGQTVTIPKGSKLDLHVSVSNTDERVFGENSNAVCPMRPLSERKPKVAEFALSFGDGPHRCPGAFVAIQESDIFLRKLLAIDTLRIEREPDVTYSEIAKGYELRNFIVAVD
ncbi:cytochrome P450 [Phototrophicus methaneseepsis]|uniref:Cytochrome P450 n=1 Tax=Phototrophicus methaneseepsis TaxID=2710758 RepID=A0A7S8IEP7_9CHLR|nr:cytochrome P450 [Phototrophicus methaneseepsis]QPC82816.1 cytochrome P450 [Phototrophicus methaneseepsis]